MAIIRPTVLLPALVRAAGALSARLPAVLAAWQVRRAERRALLDLLAKRGDRLLDDAGVARAEAERRLDVSRISDWDRWQL